MYWTNDNVCILPDTVTRTGMPSCGPLEEILLRSANGTFAGKLTLFQTSDFLLYVTFQMACPYLLRSDVDPSYAPFSAGLYAWADLSSQVRRGEGRQEGVDDMQRMRKRRQRRPT